MLVDFWDPRPRDFNYPKLNLQNSGIKRGRWWLISQYALRMRPDIPSAQDSPTDVGEHSVACLVCRL